MRSSAKGTLVSAKRSLYSVNLPMAECLDQKSATKVIEVASALKIGPAGQESSAVNSYMKLWSDTDNQIEGALKARGETFLPGDHVFEAVTSLIKANRQERDVFERAMSETINDWSAVNSSPANDM